MASVAFAAVFAVAFVFTVFGFLILESDKQSGSPRPVFVLLIAIAGWISSMFLLTNPIAQTIYSPAYTIGTPSGSVTIPAFNTIVSSNTPIPQYTGYEYMAFAGALATIDSVFLLLYMLDMSLDILIDAIKDALRIRR